MLPEHPHWRTNAVSIARADARAPARSRHRRSADIMSRSPPTTHSPSAPGPSGASRSLPAQRLWDDPVLRIAFLTIGLLLAYQLVVTLRKPVWIGPVTN